MWNKHESKREKEEVAKLGPSGLKGQYCGEFLGFHFTLYIPDLEGKVCPRNINRYRQQMLQQKPALSHQRTMKGAA